MTVINDRIYIHSRIHSQLEVRFVFTKLDINITYPSLQKTYLYNSIFSMMNQEAVSSF